MENQLVVFGLAHENYGVDIAAVQTIVKVQPITPVPHAPAHVLGLINLRGVVVPVIDLRERLGMPRSERTKDSRIVIVEIRRWQAGMLVDSVSEVLRVSSDSVEPPPALGAVADSLLVKGIARVHERLIILLDLERVFAF